MRGISTFLVAAAAATFAVGGCSSDSNNPTNGSAGAGAVDTPCTGAAGCSDSGGSAGAAGAGSKEDQCTADYAALSKAQFDSQLSSTGKCAGDSDSAVVCGNDVTTLAEECGADCLKNQAPDSATQDACVKSCIEAGTAPALSSACIGCYVTDVGCARDHCLLICGADPTGNSCLSCRLSNGCAQGFFSCSGLPSGGIGSGDAAGAGGGP